MELTYSSRKTGFEKGKNYRNPRHFVKPENGVKSVVVEGDYPAVVKAYEDAKVPVKTVAAPKKSKAAAKTDKPAASTTDNQADKE